MVYEFFGQNVILYHYIWMVVVLVQVRDMVIWLSSLYDVLISIFAG